MSWDVLSSLFVSLMGWVEGIVLEGIVLESPFGEERSADGERRQARMHDRNERACKETACDERPSAVRRGGHAPYPRERRA